MSNAAVRLIAVRKRRHRQGDHDEKPTSDKLTSHYL